MSQIQVTNKWKIQPMIYVLNWLFLLQFVVCEAYNKKGYNKIAKIMLVQYISILLIKIKFSRNVQLNDNFLNLRRFMA